jgi:hypothetical protein
MSERNAELASRDTFTDDELRNVESFADLAKLMQDKEVQSTDVSTVLGDGFTLLSTAEKRQLIKVPLAVVSWTFAQGDNGEFVSLRVITKTNQKVIINDGSTGIRDQVKDLVQRGIKPVVWVAKGLRVSEYDYEDEKTGEMKRAQTFYLDTSAG